MRGAIDDIATVGDTAVQAFDVAAHYLTSMLRNTVYAGRFAPSPSGPLHLGSLVAALASYLDAKVHDGRWLVRIEDVDGARLAAGAEHAILGALARCGMHWDGAVVRQSERLALYQTALERLGDLVYPCACTRKEIVDSQHSAGQLAHPVYPGTCRHGVPDGKHARALRLRVPHQAPHQVAFVDRWHGPVSQNLSEAVGDFVVRRADGFWAYQLAVVVDDHAQGVTHVVRGADLLDSTPRQLYLQQLLGITAPHYLHVPVVTNGAGEKLSKQNGAQAFDAGLAQHQLLPSALLPAARRLGLDLRAGTLDQFWRQAVPAWELLLRQRPIP